MSRASFKIILYEELEDKEKSIIFNGIIQNVRTTNENGIYYLELEAASSSVLLDIKEKTRSFQDAEMSYDNLINEILQDYKGYGFSQCMSRLMSTVVNNLVKNIKENGVNNSLKLLVIES